MAQIQRREGQRKKQGWPEKLEVPCTEMGNVGGADSEGHLTLAITYL